MDSVHDMGGKQGCGPLEFTDRETKGEYDPFPDEYSRGWSISLAATLGVESLEGRFRFARECIPPVLYLVRPYTDQWIMTQLALMIDAGTLAPGEIETGKARGTWQGKSPISVNEVASVYRRPYRSDRPIDSQPAFSVGEVVKADLKGSDGHIRMPAFVRGHRGTIHAYRGAHIFQDHSAHGHGEFLMHLYTVRFAMADLWPEHSESKDAVYVDLWEANIEHT